MHKSTKQAATAIALAAGLALVARADAPAPPSSEDGMVVGLAAAQWKPVPKPLPEGVSSSPIAVDPHTKGPIGYAKFAPGVQFPAHWHSHTEYTVVLAGKPTFTLEGKEHEMTVGSYIVIPAKAVHAARCSPDGECIMLTRRAGPADYHWVK
jgi:quercetin dioxygenase-like cupin family protein